MLFTLAFLLLIFFRWPILERFIGTKLMYLFDAFMFTVFAAMNFGQPSPWPWLGYFVAIVCTWLAISAGRNYLKLDAIARNANVKGNSNSGSAK